MGEIRQKKWKITDKECTMLKVDFKNQWQSMWGIIKILDNEIAACQKVDSKNKFKNIRNIKK